MNAVVHDPLDEGDCLTCGMRESDCCCTRHAPTAEELEDSREQRLTRAELTGLRGQRL